MLGAATLGVARPCFGNLLPDPVKKRHEVACRTAPIRGIERRGAQPKQLFPFSRFQNFVDFGKQAVRATNNLLGDSERRIRGRQLIFQFAPPDRGRSGCVLLVVFSCAERRDLAAQLVDLSSQLRLFGQRRGSPIGYLLAQHEKRGVGSRRGRDRFLRPQSKPVPFIGVETKRVVLPRRLGPNGHSRKEQKPCGRNPAREFKHSAHQLPMKTFGRSRGFRTSQSGTGRSLDLRNSGLNSFDWYLFP